MARLSSSPMAACTTSSPRAAISARSSAAIIPSHSRTASARSRPRRCRSEEHTSEPPVTNAHLVCRLLLEKKKTYQFEVYYNTIEPIHHLTPTYQPCLISYHSHTLELI